MRAKTMKSSGAYAHIPQNIVQYRIKAEMKAVK